jgi:uncharacterized protein with HEPN domain
MSRHSDDISLRQMLDHAREAAALANGMDRASLETNRVPLLALLQLLQIVGEAARRVSTDRQAQIASIPWPQIIGLRNRLVHGYDAVDYDAIWSILNTDLPVLIAELEKIVRPTP